MPSELLLRNLTNLIITLSKKKDSSALDSLEEDPKLQDVWDEPPIFFDQWTQAPTKFQVEDSILQLFPPSFFENPTLFMESLPNISRGHQMLPAATLNELLESPYDVSKVKTFKNLVVKRIEKDERNEVSRAREAYQAGIPTPKVLGEIWHWGNQYALFEKLKALSLYAIIQEKYALDFANIQPLIMPGIWHKKEVWRNDLLIKYPELLETFKKIYLRYSLYFEKAELMLLLHNYLLDLIEPGRAAYRGPPQDPMITWGKFRQDLIIPTHSGQELLQEIGFENIENYYQKVLGKELWHKVIKQDIENRGNLKIEILERLHYFEEPFRNARSKQDTLFQKEIWKILSQHLLGFDVKKEMEKLQKQCQKAKLKHKDFNNRNLLVPWDFSKNQPKKAKVMLYLIDWEEN